MRIKKGDTVKILSGNDKGKTGEVLEVIPKTNKIVVKGVNVRKKHISNLENKEKKVELFLLNVQYIVLKLMLFAQNAEKLQK